MRQIAHLSDLHFGTEDPLIVEGLLAELAARSPNLVAVSGDLTQRARSKEFAAAREFIQKIAQPTIVVPGNHDIPLYNVIARFLRPLAGYQHFITHDLQPLYQEDQMVVVGVNTARSNTWKNGRISLVQIQRMREQFDSVASASLKVLVAHHPFVAPEDDTGASLVGRLPLALQTLEDCGCDLILAGHLHRTYSSNQAAFHTQRKHSILIAQAGTAISHRRRDEPNTYNYIEYKPPHLSLEVRGWRNHRFETVAMKRFQRGDNGWIAEPSKGN
jgi:3',5'-cyclic AMP phosphodiesterase CpdA